MSLINNIRNIQNASNRELSFNPFGITNADQLPNFVIGNAINLLKEKEYEFIIKKTEEFHKNYESLQNEYNIKTYSKPDELVSKLNTRPYVLNQPIFDCLIIERQVFNITDFKYKNIESVDINIENVTEYNDIDFLAESHLLEEIVFETCLFNVSQSLNYIEIESITNSEKYKFDNINEYDVTATIFISYAKNKKYLNFNVDKILQLQQLIKYKKEIEVTSRILNYLNIKYLILNDITIKTVEGTEGCIEVVMNFKSHTKNIIRK